MRTPPLVVVVVHSLSFSLEFDRDLYDIPPCQNLARARIETFAARVKIIDPVGIPLMESLRHQAIKLSPVEAGEDLEGRLPQPRPKCYWVQTTIRHEYQAVDGYDWQQVFSSLPDSFPFQQSFFQDFGYCSKFTYYNWYYRQPHGPQFFFFFFFQFSGKILMFIDSSPSSPSYKFSHQNYLMLFSEARMIATLFGIPSFFKLFWLNFIVLSSEWFWFFIHSNFQFMEILFQVLEHCSKGSEYDWYYCHIHVPQVYLFIYLFIYTSCKFYKL